MSEEPRIITLPVAAVPQRTQRQDQANKTSAEVIDLRARRHAGSNQVETQAGKQSSGDLTSREVWDALHDDRVVVHYQPQYDMQSGKTVAAEALVRLVDTSGHLVYPDRFIDPVEKRDLIVPLGCAVIERVCTDLAACREHGLPIRRIAVNLSAHQITADPGLLNFIDQAVARHGLQHEDLEFELTERHSLQRHCEGQEVLSSLTERGARVVIDDFGVGYSSVTYLAELPVAAFKLDRTIVDRMLKDQPTRLLVESLLALGKNMGLDVVAEGVETKEQNDYLAAAGCPLAQGFGFARPMTIDDLMELMLKEEMKQLTKASISKSIF